jgi:hypothetical protein
MRFFLFITLAAGCVSSSKQGPPDPVDLQMNDLSVMLPLPKTQVELDAMMLPTSPAVGGTLLPKAMFDQAQIGLDFDSLHAVAFRFDPCFGQLGAITDSGACQNQLRIVWQPLFVSMVDGTTTTTSAADSGVHAFYSITRDQLIAAVDEMVAARQADGIDYDLGPLAPHPTITSEGLNGPLAQKLFQIVEKYAGGSELVRVTTFQIEAFDLTGVGNAPIVGAGEFWGFQSFDVKNGAIQPRNIPTLPTGSANNMSLSAGVNPLEANGSPATTSVDSIATLESMTKATAATTADRELELGAALRIENPHTNSPDTIDCASCHLAQPARTMVAEQLGLSEIGDANRFVPDSSIPQADLAQTTMLDTNGILNIHAFSYRDINPMINQRVINETAANLTYIKTLLQ